jgi:hypothetical protein
MGSACPPREPEGMTDQGLDTTTTPDAATDPYERGANGLLLDPDAARREERRGWIMLTGIFVAGGVLVILASLIT